MEKRHENELLAHFETLLHKGFAVIPQYKIRAWYAMWRLRSEPFEDIRERWGNFCGEEKVDIDIAKFGKEDIILINDGLVEYK